MIFNHFEGYTCIIYIVLIAHMRFVFTLRCVDLLRGCKLRAYVISSSMYEIFCNRPRVII